MKKHALVRHLAPALRLGIFSLSLALSAAYAAKPGTASGVDLDITKFHATSKVDLSSRKGADIRIDLSVKNNGSVDERRTATLVGRTIPGNSLVFNRRLEVSDPPGGGPTSYSNTISPTEIDMGPSFGGIRWTIFIADDDPDDDTATDITVVRP